MEMAILLKRGLCSEFETMPSETETAVLIPARPGNVILG